MSRRLTRRVREYMDEHNVSYQVAWNALHPETPAAPVVREDFPEIAYSPMWTVRNTESEAIDGYRDFRLSYGVGALRYFRIVPCLCPPYSPQCASAVHAADTCHKDRLRRLRRTVGEFIALFNSSCNFGLLLYSRCAAFIWKPGLIQISPRTV